MEITLAADVTVAGNPAHVKVTVDEQDGDGSTCAVNVFADFHQKGHTDLEQPAIHMCARGSWEIDGLVDVLEAAVALIRAGRSPVRGDRDKELYADRKVHEALVFAGVKSVLDR